MSKQIKAKVKLQLSAGAANPAGIGSMLGPHGVNLMKFCTDFNNATRDKKGEVVPIILTVFIDKTYDIVYKTAPVSYLIKKYSNITKGSSKVGKEVAGSISMLHIEEIAKIKMRDLNAMDTAKAINIIIGSAKSMGIKVS